ncbi:hypothetical protein AXG93_3256s1810 [Marchantia polymorpha subsp. ruderalis]|uniref:Uncharacterized protein n=1 Tax=Marchantia polymorpha subsp. ruderalis TaxID=1480154 RepID=A0A176VJ46_MARPO|nr:hypothetical protein AXG93_3256s1810 [Marchantia polymorpha subsp. ruderalis]
MAHSDEGLVSRVILWPAALDLPKGVAVTSHAGDCENSVVEASLSSAGCPSPFAALSSSPFSPLPSPPFPPSLFRPTRGREGGKEGRREGSKEGDGGVEFVVLASLKCPEENSLYVDSVPEPGWKFMYWGWGVRECCPELPCLRDEVTRRKIWELPKV